MREGSDENYQSFYIFAGSDRIYPDRSPLERSLRDLRSTDQGAFRHSASRALCSLSGCEKSATRRSRNRENATGGDTARRSAPAEGNSGCWSRRGRTALSLRSRTECTPEKFVHFYSFRRDRQRRFNLAGEPLCSRAGEHVRIGMGSQNASLRQDR